MSKIDLNFIMKLKNSLSHDYVTSVVRMGDTLKSGYYKPIPKTFTQDMVCEICGNKSMFAVYRDPKCKINPHEKTAICSECRLPEQNREKSYNESLNQDKIRYELRRQEFNEMNHIPDTYHRADIKLIDETHRKILGNSMLSDPKKNNSYGDSFFLFGDPGLGKTYTMIAFCHQMIKLTTSVEYMKLCDLQEKYFEKFRSNELQHYKLCLKDRDVLCIDELGNYDMNPAFLEFFTQILDHRINSRNKYTLIASNYVEKLFVSLGDAVADRLQSLKKLHFTGESKR